MRSCGASQVCWRSRRESISSRRSWPGSTSSTPSPPTSRPRLDANDDPAGVLDAAALEVANADLIGLKDALWAIRHDRLRTARLVGELAGRDADVPAVQAYLSIQQALSAIDRLEVRGRDSAGLHVFVWNHDIEPEVVAALVDERGVDPLFQSRTVVAAGPVLSFVYKAAAEIGELGDNTAALRAAIVDDTLLRRAVMSPDSRLAVLGHTRWASVGIISEPNTHPLNSVEVEQPGGVVAPYVVAALNGDVDNHADLRVAHDLRIAAPITTDAKVIPTLVSRFLDTGSTTPRRSAGRSARSRVRWRSGWRAPIRPRHAVPRPARQRPGPLHRPRRRLFDRRQRAVRRGRGDERVRASRRRARRRDRGRVGPTARARSMVCGASPTTAPTSRSSDDDVVTAEVTTRDINRGDAPHFLLKEISEAPLSFAKTLRGKIIERDGGYVASVGEVALPPAIAARLADGSITRIRVIGQGTAAVAGQSMATILDELTLGQLDVDAITATELSGFGMRLDMSDTLAVAVSQSGTTTDTNRTVDLLRSRGAAVIGIVNRRGSDLTDKADGVLYTSDGRDVEMSVASTKAFYAQVAAGTLLSCALAEASGLGDPARRSRLLADLRAMPDAMREVLARRSTIAEAARRHAPFHRYWAIVGNGPNKVAAEEVRIKLSELCYKSIACDSTEDKKHIDLSSEPLILVCAAGLSGSNADDVAKEVAIFRAHKATPIVVASDGETRFPADVTISVPAVDATLGFVLSAMVGHLFGYEAALAIDATARPMREAREAIEHLVGEGLSGDEVVDRLAVLIRTPAERFHDGLRNGLYDGHLEASSATRLSGLLRDMLSDRPGRAVPARHRQGRYAARPDRRSRRRADQGDRGAHAARRHDQAPGQDGHGRHLPQRRGRHRPPARAGRVGGRCRPRRVDLPHDEGARRPRPGRRRGHGLHAVSASTDDRSRSSIAAASPAIFRAASSGTPNCAARSTASPPSARCWWPRDATTGAR